MDETPGRSYEIEKVETVAETPQLRMVILTLAEGQEVPWHFHSDVTDTFFCMQGPMLVETRDPREHFDLAAGEMCMVPAQRPHRVSGKDGGRCKFALLQGVGRYDVNLIDPSDLHG